MLRLDIARNVLSPGNRITAEGLAERYGMSRTPVREAQRVLVAAVEEQVATRIVRSGAVGPLRELLAFWAEMPDSAAAGDAPLARALLRSHIWESHSFVRTSALRAAEGSAT